MSDIFEEPPDENEQYESLDEALDEEDLPGHSGASEGARDLDVDVTIDRAALEEVGAQLDDSGAEGDAVTADILDDVADMEQDPELEVVATDAIEMEEVPDDAPGADSARW